MIGILTFYWADDYGALFQCYALTTYINKYQKAILIPYFPESLRSRYQTTQKLFNLFYGRPYIKKQISELKQFYDQLNTKYKMNQFREKYLTKSRQKLSSDRSIYEFGEKTGIDIYVVGSDQVWNPEITDGIQEGYFCTFRQWSGDGKHYIAYAASLGSACLPDVYKDRLLELLSNFDSISLREQQAVPYIRQLYDKPLTAVLDPIFLLEKKEWEALVKRKKKRRKKYIAVYYTEYNMAMTEYLKDLEAKSGFNIFLLTSDKNDKNIAHWTSGSKYAIGCGPLEFLELLYHAEYVVTNSFHGTAMSIMFRKQFVAFSHSTGGARILNLLDLCHLEKRLGGMDKDIVDMDEKINWKQAEEALKKEIALSQEFIRKEILSV